MRKCTNCGASVPPSDQAVVVCKFCGSQTRAMPVVNPPPVFQPTQSQVNYQAYVNGPFQPVGNYTPRKSSSVGLLIVVGLMLAFAGYVLIKVFGAKMGLLKPRWTSWVNTQCIVDINNDGYADVIGNGYRLSGSRGSQHVAALDGRTGNTLWSLSEPSESSDQYGCGSGVLLVGRTDFQLKAIELRTGRKIWEKTLSDRFDASSFGTNCALVRSSDQQTISIDTMTGNPAQCLDVKHQVRSIYESRRALWTAASTIATDDLTFRATVRSVGTPLVTITAVQSDGQTRWSRTLQVTAIDRNNVFIGVQGNRLIVPGADINDDDYLVLTALDQQTGNVVYTTRDKLDPNENAVPVLRGYFIMGGFASIAAYDPNNGRRVWGEGRIRSNW